MEQGSREEAGAARSQNAVHVTLREAREAARLLSGALERRSGSGPSTDPTVVVVTPTADDALALSRAMLPGDGSATLPALVPLTSDRRARRLLSQRPAAVAGPLNVLGSLVAQAQLKLASVQTVGLLWVDELARPENRASLEAFLAEVPKEAHRVAFATRLEPAVEEFLDRAMWRARRVTHVPDLPPADTDVRFVLTSTEHRANALAAVLDALDPPTCAMLVTSDEDERQATATARMLGLGANDEALSVGQELPETAVDLLVFFSEPPDAAALRSAAEVAQRVVVLVPAAGLARLRSVAGASARPLLETDAFASARSAEEALRNELRETLQSGAAAAHLLALEPLIGEFDPVEVAAAAVAMLRRERQTRRARGSAAQAASEPSAARPARPVSAAAPRTARVYLSVGERDGVRRGDLVGAIAGEAGISGAQIGRIELRDSHAVVEVDADVATRVIEKMNGTNIRGRRVVAREDRERDTRAGRSGGDARAPRGDRKPREAREARCPGDAPRGRGGPAARKFAKAPAARGTSRDDARATREARGPRAAREAEEWSERAERLRRARRGPPGPRRARDSDAD